MVGTSARLLKLLSLFQGRRYWSGVDLADRLSVTSRTLRRDVDKLRSLGYPIHAASGREGGYRLGAGSTMPPLLLDDEEAVAVALGLRSAATGVIQGAEEASVRALAKIEQILPSRLAQRVNALQAMIVTSPNNSSGVDARTLSTLASACRDRLSLRFPYRDYSGKSSARVVEPYRLVHTGRRWYLVAWDASRSDWRTFRADRIERRIAVGATFVPRDPPARDLAAYVSRGTWHALPCRARIKLFAPAHSLAERLPDTLGMIEPIDDGSCYFETGAPSYEGLASHLAWIGADFAVTDPPEFVEAVRHIAARYANATAARERPRSGR